MNAQNRRTGGAESPRKVLTMLLAFSERRPHLSAEEMAREIGVPLSTAYRYISLLREVGLLQEGPQSTYAVTQRVIPLARAAQAANSLDAICQPVLERLSSATGEASLIVRRVGHTAMCVALAEANHPIRLSFEVGRPMPLHGGAAAKILLAGLTEKESTRYLNTAAAADAPLAERRAALERELEEIRRTGWAQSSGEVDRGIWAAAAAIREGKRVVAALTIACLAHSVGNVRQQEILHLVREAAGGINAHLAKVELWSRRRILGVGVVLLLACLCTVAAAQPLALRIRNDTPAPLRCVLLLSHWYSEELGPVAPGGGSVDLALESGLPDGTVVRRNDVARAMPVEGLYCLTGDADPRRTPLPLDVLRKATGVLVIACGGARPVECAVAAP